MPDSPLPNGEARLIDTAAEFRALIDHLRQAGRFAFDTEFVSEETYEPVLCLIQVATPERLAVVDPLALRDITPFWDVVTDPSIDVVMHAAGEDLRICAIQTERLPERVFDVQVAAGLIGYGYPLSLGNLAHHLLGLTLFGGETRTDWRRRPLSDGQLRYALDDVRHLLPMADAIRSELGRLGRHDWAESELRAFLETIADRQDDEGRWRRLPGLHQLSRRGLEVARRLAEWRRLDAERSNRPLRSVMRDDLLVAIAKRQPTTKKDLEALRDFNRPHLLNRSHEILAAIRAAADVRPEDLPEHSERHEEGPGTSMVVGLLAATLAHGCAAAKVSPGLTGTTQDLKDLIRWHLQGRPRAWTPALAEGWRLDVCGKSLLDVLAGRIALRIADPAAEVPVEIQTLPPQAS